MDTGNIPVRLGRLRSRDIVWLAFLAQMGVWAILYKVFIPITTVQVFDNYLINAWLAATFIGAVTASAGLILAVQRSDWARKRGVQIELAGLLIFLLGPFLYATTQLSIVLDPPPGAEVAARIPFVLFCTAMVTVVFSEVVRLGSRYKKDLAQMRVRGSKQ